MKAHIVLARPEPKSFNGHLAALARDTLQSRGWGVSTTNLYETGFNPCEGAAHYRDPVDSERFDAQSEQRNASQTKTIPPEIRKEIDLLDQADLLILQYPMWWHMPPAILKGWFDRVFVYGDVYSSSQKIENGRFAGKKALLSLTVAPNREAYAFDGRCGEISLQLWPVNFSLTYVGFSALDPQVIYGVSSGAHNARPDDSEERLQRAQDDYISRLKNIENEPTMPFNTMSDWGEDGRIKPSAPAHSPFIRHSERLEFS
ncbi:MAG: NAD(P)H-dependent oxidoreductase [Alphaproteobacteria bacterium]|nr:NAD(P)H-dependent oxidoreductase [Alphaproteobacteria bacterium]